MVNTQFPESKMSTLFSPSKNGHKERACMKKTRDKNKGSKTCIILNVELEGI